MLSLLSADNHSCPINLREVSACAEFSVSNFIFSNSIRYLFTETMKEFIFFILAAEILFFVVMFCLIPAWLLCQQQDNSHAKGIAIFLGSIVSMFCVSFKDFPHPMSDPLDIITVATSGMVAIIGIKILFNLSEYVLTQCCSTLFHRTQAQENNQPVVENNVAELNFVVPV